MIVFIYVNYSGFSNVMITKVTIGKRGIPGYNLVGLNV